MILRESSVDLPTSTGPMRTYVFAPAAPAGRTMKKVPGLVLYSEIFQKTAPIHRLAAQLCSLGHVVMVPEVYHSRLPLGTVLGYDDVGKDRGNALKQETPLADFDEGCRAVLDALAAHPGCDGRLGAFGVCLGGHLAFRAALQPDVAATACFYPTDLHTGTLGGGGADTLSRSAEIRGELLLVFGRQDPHVPVDGRRAIYDALHKAGTWFSWHEFNASHAFLRDEGERYDFAAAHLCMGLVADFFHRAL